MIDKNEALINIYAIFMTLKENIKLSEFCLNSLFIILIFIISMIIYWDTINSKVAKTSRCKRQLDMSNKNNNFYIIKATDKNKSPLYDITYDTTQYNTNVECACNPGKFINNFTNIPIRNLRTNTNTVVDKTCNCDKYYDLGYKNEKLKLDGDPGLLRYMINTDNTDFFDNLTYSPYN